MFESFNESVCGCQVILLRDFYVHTVKVLEHIDWRVSKAWSEEIYFTVRHHSFYKFPSSSVDSLSLTSTFPRMTLHFTTFDEV
jgi:hypothetical protein